MTLLNQSLNFYRMSVNLSVNVFSWLNSVYVFWQEYHRSKTYNRWCLISMCPITGDINVDPLPAFSIIIVLFPISITVLEGISFRLWKYSILPWDFYPLVFTPIVFLGRINNGHIAIFWCPGFLLHCLVGNFLEGKPPLLFIYLLMLLKFIMRQIQGFSFYSRSYNVVWSLFILMSKLCPIWPTEFPLD